MNIFSVVLRVCFQAGGGGGVGDRPGQCVAAGRGDRSAYGSSFGNHCPRDDPCTSCHAISTLWGIWERGGPNDRKAL